MSIAKQTLFHHYNNNDNNNDSNLNDHYRYHHIGVIMTDICAI